MVSVTHLNSASLYLSLVIGCPIFLLGFIGNILLILVFTSHKVSFRKSPCSHYFVAMAVMNNLHMLHGLPHRILSGGFGIDATLTSLVYCKLRQCLIMSIPFMRNTLSCIAVISQFFATSREARYRQKSTHKAAYSCITICVIFWSLHAIPYLILYKIDIVPTTNKTRCDAFNRALSVYTSWFVYNVLTFVLPGSIMAIFGYLTLRNVRRLGTNLNNLQMRLNVEHQMSSVSSFSLQTKHLLLSFSSKMLLIQVACLLITSIPVGGLNIYAAITQSSSRSSERKAIESLVETIFFVVAYINSSNGYNQYI
jgi:hypothetical protein